MVKQKGSTKKNGWSASLFRLFNYTHSYVDTLNNSKLFAGLMIIILNIASKFVTIKLSKTMEAYLKYTFSRQILIFAIAWMGTRDIYIAITITLVFVFFMDFLFNEESRFCVLPEAFTDYHTSLLETNSVDNTANTQSSPISQSQPTNTDKPITEEDIAKAKDLLERAKQQNLTSNNTGFFVK
jgi:hypothetical protein